MDITETNIQLAVNKLCYASSEEVAQDLTDLGATPEVAFLITMAAKVYLKAEGIDCE